MKLGKGFIPGIALTVLLAMVLMIRMTCLRSGFDKTVKGMMTTSEGYDQKFINMVWDLEDELAMRAQFGYQGGKDPMTGQERQVAVERKPVKGRRTALKPKKGKRDPFKLTAIIYDNKTKRHTAILKVGDRSYSAEEGERIQNRVIRKITDKVVYMEGDTLLYKYDLFGSIVSKTKR
jgi:hypothetical protein